MGSGTVPVVAVAPRPHASVAVLPFINLNAEPDSEYFSDGLTEELIHALSRLPGLQVVSRTSAFEFKGKPQNVRTIGEQLKVSAVVEGSVRKQQDRVRVSTQLVNVSDGYCLWSQRFDCKMTDIFEVQEEMAESIADLLKVELGSKSRMPAWSSATPKTSKPTTCICAGAFNGTSAAVKDSRRRWSTSNVRWRWIRSMLRRTRASPTITFPLRRGGWRLQPKPGPRPRKLRRKALESDDSLAEAHASLGVIRMWYEWDWKEAEREFLRAIELKPGQPLPHVHYSLLLVQTGRFEEAEEQIRLALASDPLSVPANVYLAGVYHYRRDYDRSLEQAGRALDLDPNDIEAHVVMAINYEQKHQYAEAIAELEKAHKLADYNPLILGPLGSCYGGLGDKEKALSLLEELNTAAAQIYVAPISWVMLYLGIGDIEHAFEWLEKAAEARDVLLYYLKVGPIYDKIREDPRYEALLDRVGLSDDVAELKTVTQHSG